MSEKRDTGREAEVRAERILMREGLSPVARNYRCRGGEIDLVMHDGETLVFVEVRGRSNPRFGSPAETVTGAKQARLIRTAQVFLLAHPKFTEWPCRFDVLALATAGREPRARWIQDAFDAG